MQPLISVIVPIYNAEKYLVRCLDSLIMQDYRNLEIILVNDGSSDRSPVICDEYAVRDSRIKVIHKINAGVSEARNSGLDIATGDYIHCTDSDDWVEPYTFTVLAGTVTDSPCDIVRFNAYNSSRQIINALPFRGVYEGKALEEVALSYMGAPKLGGMFILGVPWLYLFSRKLIEDNNIRFNKELRRCEDRLFTLTAILYSQKVTFIDDVLYNYETSGDSLSNKYDPIRWEQELYYLSELKKEYTGIRSQEFVNEANKRLDSEYLLRAMTSINNEFFSDNKNKFSLRYSNTKKIVNTPDLIKSVKYIQKEKLGLKGDILVWLIKHRQAFWLSLFNTLILYKNKIR